MLRHIVMWRFKDEAEGKTKLENMEYAKEKLLALKGVIPEIRHIELGFNVSESDMAYDMVLIIEFADRDALGRYNIHPRHKEVSEYVTKVRTDRAVADYII
jgi:hypothetical protein